MIALCCHRDSLSCQGILLDTLLYPYIKSMIIRLIYIKRISLIQCVCNICYINYIYCSINYSYGIVSDHVGMSLHHIMQLWKSLSCKGFCDGRQSCMRQADRWQAGAFRVTNRGNVVRKFRSIVLTQTAHHMEIHISHCTHRFPLKTPKPIGTQGICVGETGRRIAHDDEKQREAL